MSHSSQSDTSRLFLGSAVAPNPACQTFERLSRIYEERAVLEAAIQPGSSAAAFSSSSGQSPLSIRWVPPHQWHLTWRYLGNTPNAAIPEIQARLGEALRDTQSVATGLSGLTLWPSARRARLVVALLQPTPDLMALSSRIASALPEFPADKPFHPHITMARLKHSHGRSRKSGGSSSSPTSRRQSPTEVTTSPAGLAYPVSACWRVDDVTLYQSILNEKGPEYSPVARYILHSSPLGSCRR